MRKSRTSPPKETTSPSHAESKVSPRRPIYDYSSMDSDVENRSPCLPGRGLKVRQRKAPKDVSMISGHLGGDEASVIERDGLEKSEGLEFTDHEVDVLQDQFHQSTPLDSERKSSLGADTNISLRTVGNSAFVASRNDTMADENIDDDNSRLRSHLDAQAHGKNPGDTRLLSTSAILTMVDNASATSGDMPTARNTTLTPRQQSFELPPTPSSQDLSVGSGQKHMSSAVGSRETSSSSATMKTVQIAPNHEVINDLRESDDGGHALASPSELDAAFPDNTTRNNAISLGDSCDDTPVASSTPRNSFGHISLKKLKNSRLARRMSMNTPPSQLSNTASLTQTLNHCLDLPSSLDSSEYRFPKEPVRYEVWDPTSVPLEFSPLLPVDTPATLRNQGTDAPPNSVNSTPIANTQRARQQAQNKQNRVRSKSDPLGVIERSSDSSDGGEKMLFTPSRIGGGQKEDSLTSQNADQLGGSHADIKSAFSSDSATDGGKVDTTDDGEDESQKAQRWVLGTGPLLPTNFLSDGDTNRLWSGFTQDFQGPPGNSSDPSRDRALDDISESKASEQMSLNLGDAHVRYETPLSIIAQHGKVRSLSDASADHAPALDGETMAFRHRIMQLERYIKTLESREHNYRSEAGHWQNQFQHLQATLEQYRRITVDVNSHITLLDGKERQKESQGETKTSDPQPGTDSGQSDPQNLGPDELEEKIKHLEEKLTKAHTMNQEKDKEIGHLLSALNQRKILGQSAESVQSLQSELQEMKERHKLELEQQEEKFHALMTERDGELFHLQAELDEMANLMPVEHGSSSRTMEADVEEWYEEKTREMGEYLDQSIDKIITELHNIPDSALLEAAEAEESLRRIAIGQGFAVTDKVSLAAFGIRHLRQEHEQAKELLLSNEEKVAVLSKLKDEFSKKEQALIRTIRQLESENHELQEAVTAGEGATKRLRQENSTLEQKVVDWMKRVDQLKEETKRLLQVQQKVKAVESERDSLRSSLQSTTTEMESWRVRLREAEARAQRAEAESANMKKHLSDSTNLSDVERASLGQRISQLEQAVLQYRHEIEALQRKLGTTEAELVTTKRAADALHNETSELRRKLEEANKQVLEAQNTLEQAESEHRENILAAEAENSVLTRSFKHIDGQHKLIHTQLENALADIAAKEAQWRAIKTELEEKTRVQRDPEADKIIDAYDHSLSRILAEMDQLPWEFEDEEALHDLVAEFRHADLAKPETVATVVYMLRNMYETTEDMQEKVRDLEVKNSRLKSAIKNWGSENSLQKGRLEKLMKENAELSMLLRAEKKQSDDKIAQLILALRR